ncbi:MAG: hypothetical protein WBG57_00605 [Ornithinimicrobium sp.]
MIVLGGMAPARRRLVLVLAGVVVAAALAIAALLAVRMIRLP